MLEIDGEFFEDPCENIRAERIRVLKRIAQDAILQTYKENKKISKIILDTAKVQMALVWAQPAFPPKFAAGGIVNPNTYKGDIVCQPKSDFINKKKRQPDLLDMRLLSMMEDMELKS